MKPRGQKQNTGARIPESEQKLTPGIAGLPKEKTDLGERSRVAMTG